MYSTIPGARSWMMASTREARSRTDVKVIILGSAAVGKTCLLQRYLTGDFKDDTISSIGASLALKKWGDWNIALWDTAGEEKYASLSAFYCRESAVAILAFDLTNRESLNKLNEIFIPLLADSVESCLTVVVGTKLDLVESEGRQVKSSEGQELAAEQLAFHLERAQRSNPDSYLKDIDGTKLYFETSSKTGKGVTELFEKIQSIIMPQLQKVAPPATLKEGRGKSIRLDDPVPTKGKGSPGQGNSGRCCGGSAD